MELDIVLKDKKYKPSYANPEDACMDIKAYIPNGKVTIEPGHIVKIETGVQVSIPSGYVMMMFVRSSTGIKKNLVLANGTGIIDSGYKDPIIMALYNTGNIPVEVFDGDRLGQFILLPYPKVELNEVEDNDDFRSGDRGGGIGSTDKKK